MCCQAQGELVLEHVLTDTEDRSLELSGLGTGRGFPLFPSQGSSSACCVLGLGVGKPGSATILLMKPVLLSLRNSVDRAEVHSQFLHTYPVPPLLVTDAIVSFDSVSGDLFTEKNQSPFAWLTAIHLLAV